MEMSEYDIYMLIKLYALSTNQTLLFHIQISLFVQEVSLIVFKLFLDVRTKLSLLRLPHQLLVQGEGIVDSSDVFEVDGIRDL